MHADQQMLHGSVKPDNLMVSCKSAADYQVVWLGIAAKRLLVMQASEWTQAEMLQMVWEDSFCLTTWSEPMCRRERETQKELQRACKCQ